MNIGGYHYDDVELPCEGLDRFGAQPSAGASPLTVRSLFNLLFKPREFFGGAVDIDFAFARWVLVAVTSLSFALGLLDARLLKALLPEGEAGMTVLQWQADYLRGGVGVLVLLMTTLIGSRVLWDLCGAWYRARLRWAGELEMQPNEGRLIMLWGSLISAVPILAYLVWCATSGRTVFERPFQDHWALVILLVPVWSCLISYKGVVARYPVDRKKASIGFLVGPIAFYLGLAALAYKVPDHVLTFWAGGRSADQARPAGETGTAEAPGGDWGTLPDARATTVPAQSAPAPVSRAGIVTSGSSRLSANSIPAVPAGLSGLKGVVEVLTSRSVPARPAGKKATPASIDELVREIRKTRETAGPAELKEVVPAATPAATPRHPASPIDVEIEQVPLSLTAIHFDGETTSATINGKVVVEGRDYGLFRVLEIGPDEVTVQCPGRDPVVLRQ